MTTKRIATAVALAVVASAALAAPARARWWGDGRWHDDDRGEHHHGDYDGYHYRPPPVVYGTPYNYGDYPPPVVYDNAPGVGFNVHIGP